MTIELTAMETKVLQALRDNREGGYRTREGIAWGTVYLDNARPSDMTALQFGAVLSNLQQKGLYERETDPQYAGFFGYVKVDE